MYRCLVKHDQTDSEQTPLIFLRMRRETDKGQKDVMEVLRLVLPQRGLQLQYRMCRGQDGAQTHQVTVEVC